ncbi:MAG: helix-turn-helix domain-containing protein [Mangrovibacterium sp.]
MVNKWRQRFLELGLDGLKDASRPGKKPTISAQQKVMVIQKAWSKPEGYTNWS